jgi:DNA-binding transcriptional MerR regulator
MLKRKPARKAKLLVQAEPRWRSVDLAREHGLSTQAVRNYEHDALLPAANRTPSGYRVYSNVHVQALRAYLALARAHGYATAREVLHAVNRGDLDAALRAIDSSHAQLLGDRETLDAVETAVGLLTRSPTASGTERPLAIGAPTASGTERPLAIGALAARIGVVPATLRKWERAGILAPERDPATRYRLYAADAVRDAQLAHLLRRGGYRLEHIARVMQQVRGAGGREPLAASLADWRQRLATRGRAMLAAAGQLAEYLRVLESRSAGALL